MKSFALLLSLLCTSPAKADAETACQSIHWQMGDSTTVQVHPERLPNRRTTNMRLAFAEEMVRKAFSSCSGEELGINISDRSRNYCRRVLEGEDLSDMCYLSGSFGYYFVHVNLMDIAVVSFNRWD